MSIGFVLSAESSIEKAVVVRPLPHYPEGLEWSRRLVVETAATLFAHTGSAGRPHPPQYHHRTAPSGDGPRQRVGVAGADGAHRPASAGNRREKRPAHDRH